MAKFIRINNTVNDAYRNYYGNGDKSVKIEVQITQDNKVVVHLDDVHHKRLKQLRNINKTLVTLEEFLKHTPEDMQIIVEINRFDDKDFAYRVIHFAEENYSKDVKMKKFIYASTDKKFCKHIQCMKRPVYHIHTSFDTLDPYYFQIGVTKEMLLENPEALQTYQGVYVNGITQDEYPAYQHKFPWVKGWIVPDSIVEEAILVPPQDA